MEYHKLSSIPIYIYISMMLLKDSIYWSELEKKNYINSQDPESVTLVDRWRPGLVIIINAYKIMESHSLLLKKDNPKKSKSNMLVRSTYKFKLIREKSNLKNNKAW